MNASKTANVPKPVSKYKGFISYSHTADKDLAAALQRDLQKFAKPWYRWRAIRIFRDETNLPPSSKLSSSIKQALADSDYLILLASKQAAQSDWVEQEIDWWIINRSVDTILIVLTDGELLWDSTAKDYDWSKTSALPRRLEKAYQEEPNHLDLRYAKTGSILSLKVPSFHDDVARLSAVLQGRSLDQMIGEDRNQHLQMMRFVRVGGAGLVIAILLSFQAYYSVTKDNRDRENKVLQERRQKEADRLAAKSIDLLAADRELAILLAVEAVNIQATDDALSALRQSLFEEVAPELTLSENNGEIYFVKFSPDSKRVITGGADQAARVWDLSAGAKILELQRHTAEIQNAEFNPDGGRIVTVSPSEQEVRLWDSATGKSLIDLHPKNLIEAKFSPNNQQLLTLGDSAILWDVQTGKQLYRLIGGYAEMRGASWLSPQSAYFSPDGKRVALVDWSRGLIYDALSGKLLFNLEGEPTDINDISFSTNGQWLVTASNDKAVRIWHAGSGKSSYTLAHDHAVNSAFFTPGDQWLITATNDGVVHVWSVASRMKTHEINPWPKELVSFEPSPDGNFLLTAFDDGTVEVLETRTGAKVTALSCRTSALNALSFSPDGRHIAAAEPGGKVSIYAFNLAGSAQELLSLAQQRATRKLTPTEKNSTWTQRFLNRFKFVSESTLITVDNVLNTIGLNLRSCLHRH